MKKSQIVTLVGGLLVWALALIMHFTQSNSSSLVFFCVGLVFVCSAFVNDKKNKSH